MRTRLVAVSVILIAPLAVAQLPAAVRAQAPTFITSWGSFGTGHGQFRTPVGVATSTTGDVYVVDSGNISMGNRVQKFTSSGGYLLQWGSPGPGIGQFDTPGGLALDPEGNVYVCDSGNNRVQKFTSTGAYITQWGSEGLGSGQFRLPSSIAVGANRNVYVADGSNHRIQVFTDGGTYLSQWAVNGGVDGVAVDASGNVYATDHSSRVQKFTASGTLLTVWGSQGIGNGQFNGATRLAVGPEGSVYVVDYGNNRVQVFTSTGAYITQWGSFGYSPGQFNYPIGVAVDALGNVYVADTNNSRIQKFGQLPTPTKLATWGRIKTLYR